MKLFDLIIIYFACGAPFAVNYFFQNQTKGFTKIFFIKSFFVFLFWLPFVFQFVLRLKIKKGFFKDNFPIKLFSDDYNEKNLSVIQKQFEYFFCADKLQMSIYEFREITKRYIGLTIAIQHRENEPTAAEKNIFLITNSPKTELSAICLHRRNRKCLSYHQNLARREFLNTFTELFDSTFNKKELGELTIELVTLLNDVRARSEIEKLFEHYWQTEMKSAIKHPKKDLWKKQEITEC